MKIKVDTHTHSVASGHAYSTVQELAREARRKGLSGFVLTDHGPSMKGAPFLYHFGNQRVIPPVLNGVRFFKGIEANIIDFEGNIDYPRDYYVYLDFMLAGFHEICLEPGSLEENTRAAIRVMENPWVDAVSHPGNPVFPLDIDAFTDAAAGRRKLVEINNSSFAVRKGSADRCEAVVRACVSKGVRMVCGSDAHIASDIGRADRVLPLFSRIGVPDHLVVNSSLKAFTRYLEERRERIASSEAAFPAPV